MEARQSGRPRPSLYLSDRSVGKLTRDNICAFGPAPLGCSPSARRCLALGRAIGRAIGSFEPDLNVQVWGTGGMSHQLSGQRAGLINSAFDHDFMDRLIERPDELAEISHVELVREAGSEGIELVMWLIARGAMGDLAGRAAPTLKHRFYHVPASNTAVGHLILEESK
jgi:protocatechuate 4,5-dioxygenase beta chain